MSIYAHHWSHALALGQQLHVHVQSYVSSKKQWIHMNMDVGGKAVPTLTVHGTTIGPTSTNNTNYYW